MWKHKPRKTGGRFVDLTELCLFTSFYGQKYFLDFSLWLLKKQKNKQKKQIE